MRGSASKRSRRASYARHSLRSFSRRPPAAWTRTCASSCATGVRRDHRKPRPPSMHIESLILAACGGFLLAVLWMDLMFDVQVLPHRTPELPEPVVSSIAAYYRRVT